MSKTISDDAEIEDVKTGKKTIEDVTTDPPAPAKPVKKNDNTLIWLAVIVLIVTIGIFMYKNMIAKKEAENNGPNPE